MKTGSGQSHYTFLKWLRVSGLFSHISVISETAVKSTPGNKYRIFKQHPDSDQILNGIFNNKCINQILGIKEKCPEDHFIIHALVHFYDLLRIITVKVFQTPTIHRARGSKHTYHQWY